MKNIYFLLLLPLSLPAQAYLHWTNGPSLDLGEVDFQKGKTAQFEFKNIGQDTLTIETVRTDCSCTTLDFPEKPIAPQESATLTVNFQPNLRNDFNKTIKLYFFEKKKGIKLRIYGTVDAGR